MHTLGLILLFTIGMALGFTIGHRQATISFRDYAVRNGHGEYYTTEDSQMKQFHWKEHPFTWSDLDFNDYPEKTRR